MRMRKPESKGYRLTKGRQAMLDSGMTIEQILGMDKTVKLNTTEPMASNAITITDNTQQFTINQRFEFVEKLVDMVASGVQPSALITGRGGVGKSFTVTQALSKAGYQDVSSYTYDVVPDDMLAYRVIKGHSSAKGLYRTMYQNNDKILVLDDCDSVFDNDSSLNLLKGALDSYDKRIISWNSEMKTDELPGSFEYTGRIIFVSNRSQDSIDQAVRSRALTVDLAMTNKEMIDRMEFISTQAEFLPEYSDDVKIDALDFLERNVNKVKNLSLRSLITVAKVRYSNEDWEDMATYLTC